jgi:protein-tyrosine phosphatase
MQDMGIQYVRYAVSKTPPAGDFDFLRAFFRDLPKGSKVLIHCGDGNRAAAMICPWLVLDKGVPIEKALRMAKDAGLQLPETESAVRRYIASKVQI